MLDFSVKVFTQGENSPMRTEYDFSNARKNPYTASINTVECIEPQAEITDTQAEEIDT